VGGNREPSQKYYYQPVLRPYSASKKEAEKNFTSGAKVVTFFNGFRTSSREKQGMANAEGKVGGSVTGGKERKWGPKRGVKGLWGKTGRNYASADRSKKARGKKKLEKKGDRIRGHNKKGDGRGKFIEAGIRRLLNLQRSHAVAQGKKECSPKNA